MSQIKPYRSFTSASLAADFHAIKVLFHADDFTNGASSWAARYGGLTINMSGALTKDSSGVYTTATRTVSSVTGTMPTLSKYIALVGIGKLQTASQTVGSVVTFGSVDGTASGITSNGLAYTAANSGVVNSVAALTGSVTAGSLVSSIGFFDNVDTTSPAIYRILASATAGDQAIANGSATTDLLGVPNDPIAFSTFGNSMACIALTSATAGARIKVIAVLDFSVTLSLGELEVAAAEMARTQELFAGWRNRAAA